MSYIWLYLHMWFSFITELVEWWQFSDEVSYNLCTNLGGDRLKWRFVDVHRQFCQKRPDRKIWSNFVSHKMILLNGTPTVKFTQPDIYYPRSKWIAHAWSCWKAVVKPTKNFSQFLKKISTGSRAKAYWFCSDLCISIVPMLSKDGINEHIVCQLNTISHTFNNNL